MPSLGLLMVYQTWVYSLLSQHPTLTICILDSQELSNNKKLLGHFENQDLAKTLLILLLQSQR
jgi:hypothetical protein